MERNHIRSLIVGIMACLMMGAYGIDYELQYEQLFINNKTNHNLVIRFCNEDHNEQQQYPIKAHEKRPVRVKIGVMQKLAMVSVTMKVTTMIEHPKKKKKKKKITKKIVKEIDYDKDAGIVGLEISMHPELDLVWRHADEYVINAPSEG